jgi:hypothetical protein
VGQPGLGLALGSLAGSLLFPTQLPAGPRITDNRTTTATIGEPVPLLFGTADLAGTVIWLAPVVETASEQGGKGGPEQKVFNYNQSIAIGLCERVDDTADASIGAIGGVTRIWENGTIVYDIRPQQQANTALGFVAETDAQYADRLAVSAQYAETFTLYLGDELQDADPTIEAIEGVGNVPGFRALAYVVYPNRALTIAQGLRHPNFTFECYENGTGECTDEPISSNEVIYPWFDSRNTYTYKITVTPSGSGTSPAGNTYTNVGDAIAASEAFTGISQALLIGHGVPTTSIGSGGGNPIVPAPGSVEIGGSIDPSTVQINYNFTQPTGGIFDIPQDPNTDPSSPFATPGKLFWSVSSPGGGTGLCLVTNVSWTSAFAFPPWDSPYQTGSRWTNFFWFEALRDLQMNQARTPGAPDDPCFELPPAPTNPGYATRPDGTIVKCNTWVKDTSGATSYKVLQTFQADANTPPDTNFKTRHPLNPCLPITAPDYDNATFWEAAYTQAVADGTMASGLTYGTDYPVVQNWAYIIDQVICEGSGTQANIAQIIAALCKRAGLAESQIDVSDLSAVNVAGYSISSICDAADIISPLRTIAFFDCVGSGNVLRFPTRGKEIVATLTADQIGCFDGGSTGADGSSSTNIPPSVAVVRRDETTLPRSIRLHYKAVSRDYQDDEQDSPFRLTALAVDDQDISIPICIGDTQALQAAQISWSDAWAGQNSYTINVDQSLAALECGDCIGVPVDGFIQRMRIVNDSNSAFVLRKLSCVADNQGSYISFAVAAPRVQKPSTLAFLSPSLAVFLNIPSLQDVDNNAGFYVVAYPDPTSGNKWNGATFYQSIDGTNFSQVATSTQAGTVGTMDSAVPPSESFTWDTTTVLTVNLPASESFESRTDDAVLAGANAAAMGADGRWEIIQFATATQITPTQWQLSRLLRGRRGTEYAMGSSQAGDQFVMVSTGDLVRVPMNVSQIGGSYVYKVVSVGAAFSTGNTYDFISRGTALVPFSPVDAHANFVSDGDIEISWTRRDRLGETLMSGMDIPLSDFPESFQVDIVEAPHSPSSPAVVFRTLATGTTSALYTAAQFATDYAGESPHSPETIYVRIYQMSLTMGRGTPEVATLAVT